MVSDNRNSTVFRFLGHFPRKYYVPFAPIHYCANPKTVNTRIISGMLLCCEEKANQMQDKKTASCNGSLHCCLRFLISYLIGRRRIKMSKSNQSVHGFWIHTVISRMLCQMESPLCQQQSTTTGSCKVTFPFISICFRNLSICTANLK